LCQLFPEIDRRLVLLLFEAESLLDDPPTKYFARHGDPVKTTTAPAWSAVVLKFMVVSSSDYSSSSSAWKTNLMDWRSLQMAMLAFVPLDSGVVFGIFLEIMQFRMLHDASYFDRLTDMFCQRDGALAAVNLPGASVFSNKKIFVSAFGLGQTSGDRPVLWFGFLVRKAWNRANQQS
jgi:hypothetical protein